MGNVVYRTCIGCRVIDEPDRFVRLSLCATASGAVVVIDHHRKLGGRGAWLHPTEQCVQNAVRRRAFNRAFRGPVEADAAVQELEQMIRRTDLVRE